MPDYPAQPIPAIEVPESIQASVEAELRQEAAQSTAQPTPDPQPEPTPTPQVTPQPQAPEPPPDPQEQERGYMRDKDYRQKTMKHADEVRAFEARQREWEAQRQAEYAQRQREIEYVREAQQAINDAQWLEQRLNALKQQQTPPDQPLTAQQVQQLLAQREAQLTATFNRQIQDTFSRYEIDRSALDFNSKIQAHQQALLKEHPVLELIPGVEKLIVNDAMAQKPTTWDDASAYMRQAAADRAAKLQKKIADSEQAAIMRHAKQAQPAIEPKGGTVPAVPSVRNYKLGSQALQDSIYNDLLQEQATKR